VTAIEMLAEVARALRGADVKFRVGGSVASSVWGDPRQTNDIDISILKSTLSEDRLRSKLPEPYYIGPDEIREALAERQDYASFQILNVSEAFKIDAFVVEPTDYYTTEFSRVREVELLPGITVPVASAEDIVLHKLRWFVLGGNVSDRQWNDIIRVLETQANRLDMDYLAHWAAYFQVDQLLDEALDQRLTPDNRDMP
jgi:hypothetical protein